MTSTNNSAKEIVVAVDGSAASEAAVRWAANAAAQRQQPIKLATAYTLPQFMYADGMVPPQELYDELETDAQAKVDHARQLIAEEFPSLTVNHQVKEVSPIDFLLELSENAEMLVMGSRGLGGLSGLVMGSVSAAVVSHASCPVVVVRKESDVEEANEGSRVVVGVDGSTVSRQAIQLAFQEAHARRVPLRAVLAWTDAQFQASLVGALDSRGDLEKLNGEYQDLLHSELAPMREKYPDVEVEELVERERAVHALKTASEGAQLLVLGSHGRGGFRGMLLGSTSRALLQYAPCPMMVVRQARL